MSIIQIRGTSGSGKSTVMRWVMERLGDWNSIHITGRKRPLYYQLADKKDIKVVGHYESQCGGGDTIGCAREVCELIQSLKFDHMLAEGLLLSEDVKWSSQLEGLRIVYLTTGLEQCLANIEKRRKEAGNNNPLNPAKTENRIATIESARIRLSALGVQCCRASANQALGIILKWIKGDYNAK